MADNDEEKRIVHLTVRNLRTLAGDGKVAVTSTVFCPIQQRSTDVPACERCDRFQALHLDLSAQRTSVMCCAGEGEENEQAPTLRQLLDGPPDPETPVSAIMTTDVACVRADVDAREIEAILLDRKISGVPVVDGEGKPVGVVSRADVLALEFDRADVMELQHVTARPRGDEAAALDRGYHLEPVGVTADDIMTAIVFKLHESASIGQAAALMAFEGVHRLPIVSDAGEVVGIVSSLDVLRWLGQRSGYLVPSHTGPKSHVQR